MENRKATNAEIIAQIPAAKTRGRLAKNTEPRAKRARYSSATGLLTVSLTNGAMFSFPVQLVAALRKATSAEIARVETSPSGEGLLWPDLDVDLSVAGMLQAILGGRLLMRELGRSGGLARTDAKVRAARLNGAKGGRPRAKKVPLNTAKR